MPSARTIYRWIYDKYLLNGNLKVLRRKRKSHLGKETRGKFNLGKSIRKRDKSVYKRKEADTVVSGQGKSKACFATLAERKTRLYLAMKIPNRKANTMATAIVSMLSDIPSSLVKKLPVTEAPSLPIGKQLRRSLDAMFILLIRTVLGRKALTRTATDSYENSTPRGEISQELALKHFCGIWH